MVYRKQAGIITLRSARGCNPDNTEQDHRAAGNFQ